MEEMMPIRASNVPLQMHNQKDSLKTWKTMGDVGRLICLS